MSHALLRCDATPEGGVGHLVRALAVARAARDAGWTVALAGQVTSALGHDLLEGAGLRRVDVPAEGLAVLAAEQGAVLVHVDDYATGTAARSELARAGALLSSMEDGTFGRRPADVVVDSTLGADDTERPEDGSGLVLRGIGYAPMREDVLRARENRRERARSDEGTPLRGLVVAGGTDAVGAAAVLAGVARATGRIGELVVVAPRGRWDDVRATAGEGVDLREPFPGVLDLAADMDVVLSAAGTTAWELACVGVPTVLVAVVDNQVPGYEAAVARGFALGLGSLTELRRDTAAGAVRLAILLDDLGRYERPDGVDGRGAARIVESWEDVFRKRSEMLLPDGLVARPATSGDALVLLRWRNDPSVRAVSRSSELVPWREHRTWLAGVLDDPARRLYVIEHGGVRVATVRFDLLDAGEWEVSITLAPEARGRGLAGAVLSAAEVAFTAGEPGATLVAAILPDNAPSQRLFVRAGYQHVPGRKDGDFDVLVKDRRR
ncbi:bifunctional UDP-2,4-diacetamido-2,4,6-trideoxy-beta-L-altropyranose hydrolase/GNAT family N-acetyltransferase [Cellulosimicrobium cellulans]|uniref:bifunctional UDP-2,4-diacetamido-2,4,6-trideoxy-beta-L-altropyranose hydrolase/GNAT family N-acetyltransferase n=1 Tax=Cellulosimicrobium cellulans TaxID=1710 RepID=UPI003019C2A4